MAIENGIYLRPFLDITRAQTVAACKELNLEPWSDPHNDDESFLRVKARKNVLPVMESELGPGIRDALVRSAQLLRDDADALDALAKEFWQSDQSLEVAPLAALPKAIRTRVLRLALFESGVSQLSAEQVAQVEALISNWKGQGEVSLPAGVKVSRISGRLTLS
jgi:tRNA(Ile)-lysidine synthase